jgi:hypothetical protein
MSVLKQQDPTVKSRKKRTHSEIGSWGKGNGAALCLIAVCDFS